MADMVSSAVVVIIIVASSILVLNAINPIVDESRDFQKFNEARETLNKIDTAISDLLFEAPGARRSIDIDVKDGRLSVSGGDDSIKLRIDNVDIFSSGLRTEEGNILITSGPSMRAYESDIDSDGNTDLVMENGLVLFAIRKIGSPSSYATVNTTTMITMLKNKRLNVNVSHPLSGIFINDLATTAYGTGYSELTKLGEGLESSSIHVFVNATAANVTYDATFSLSTSMDFIDLQVSHVTGV